MLDCPPTYYADGESGNRHCKVCVGKCKKECQGGTIDSFADAQRYRGCSHIKGALTIQIRSQGGREYKNTKFSFSFVYSTITTSDIIL